MERDSSLFVPEINCFCWECREAERRGVLQLLLGFVEVPRKHPAAIYLFIFILLVFYSPA